MSDRPTVGSLVAAKYVSKVLRSSTPIYAPNCLAIIMVELTEVHKANSTLVQSQPLVAVFFGGTSGIGHQSLRALAAAEAEHNGKGLRAYIVGRNATAAEEIIAECRGLYPQGQYHFIKIDDLSLIKNVDRVCADIIQQEQKEGSDARIDYLMMSQGGSIWLSRTGRYSMASAIS